MAFARGQLEYLVTFRALRLLTLGAFEALCHQVPTQQHVTIWGFQVFVSTNLAGGHRFSRIPDGADRVPYDDPAELQIVAQLLLLLRRSLRLQNPLRADPLVRLQQ